jgi:hypothetical protein
MEGQQVTPTDIRICLRADHDRVLRLARDVTRGSRPRRPDLFHELRDLVGRHRRAEAAVVYPALRSLRLPDSHVLGNSGQEEQACNRLVEALENDQMPNLKWRAMAQLLLNLLTLHVREQHRLLVPLLSHRLSPQAREELGFQYRRVLTGAPAGRAVTATAD